MVDFACSRSGRKRSHALGFRVYKMAYASRAVMTPNPTVAVLFASCIFCSAHATCVSDDPAESVNPSINKGVAR